LRNDMICERVIVAEEAPGLLTTDQMGSKARSNPGDLSLSNRASTSAGQLPGPHHHVDRSTARQLAAIRRGALSTDGDVIESSVAP
jgi:hypothetical protein